MQPSEAAAQTVDRRPLNLGEMMLGGLAANFENAPFELEDGLTPSAARVDGSAKFRH
jgi:hypothetical protein